MYNHVRFDLKHRALFVYSITLTLTGLMTGCDQDPCVKRHTQGTTPRAKI